MAKRLAKIVGLALVALVWLPSSFLGRHEASGLWAGNQIRERISVEATFVVASLIQQAQLLKVRLAGVPNKFAKKSGTDFLGPGWSGSRADFEPSEIRLLPSAANDLLKTWQFVCRTALHPRAPCQV